MKLIIENPFMLEAVFEDEINETIGEVERNYYIQGIFSTPETLNRNGRFYPRNIWEKEVKEYQNEIVNRTDFSLGEYEHPPRTTIDRNNAVIRIVELKINEEGNVWGKAKILNDNTQLTNKLKGLIKENFKIGVSSRGVGTVNEEGVVEEFKLITYDVVSTPSDYNAMLDGLQEGYQFMNGVVQDKEYKVNESGCITECSLEKPKKVEEPKETDLDESDYIHAQALKLILDSKGADKLCDLDLDLKEEVLKEYLNAGIEYNSLVEKYEDYVKEYKELEQEKLDEKQSKKDGFAELAKKLKKFNLG